MKLIGLLLFLSLACYSQVQDSALYQILNIPNDTERVNQLYKTGFDLRNSNPQLAYQYAKACEEEGLKCNSPKHLAKSYNLLGLLFYKKADYSKALQYQKKSLELNQSVQNQFGIAINQANLGNIYSDINYLGLAEYSYLQSLQASNKTNNTLQITRCLINLGVLKFSQKAYEPAIRQFKEALIYAEEINDYDLIANCNNNIGAILIVQNKPDSALQYLEEGLKIIQLTDNEFEEADYYNNIANVYIKKHEFAIANHYILITDSICKKYDYTEALLELYHTKSLFYAAQKNYEQAYFWIKQHYQLKDSLQKINKATIDMDFIDNQNLTHTDANHESLNNQWLLLLLILLIIGIPLFLIQFKR
jgi:tetratricopeptide (TPR) repeat protein